LGEIGIFGQEAVARMDSFHSVVLANLDDVVDVKVGCYGRLFSVEEEGLVGLVTVLGEAVCCIIQKVKVESGQMIYNNTKVCGYPDEAHKRRGIFNNPSWLNEVGNDPTKVGATISGSTPNGYMYPKRST